MEKKLKLIENISYYLGLVLAAFGLYKIYMSRKGLAPGMCPIDDNREYLIGGIIFLVISIGVGFYKDRKFKIKNKE